MTFPIQPLPQHQLQSPAEEDQDSVVRRFPQPHPSRDGAADHPSGSLGTWEYKAALGGAGAKDATERLNALGAEGWELVGVEPPQPGGQTILYLKRPRRS